MVAKCLQYRIEMISVLHTFSLRYRYTRLLSYFLVLCGKCTRNPIQSTIDKPSKPILSASVIKPDWCFNHKLVLLKMNVWKCLDFTVKNGGFRNVSKQRKKRSEYRWSQYVFKHVMYLYCKVQSTPLTLRSL